MPSPSRKYFDAQFGNITIAACYHMPTNFNKKDIGVLFLHSFDGCKLGPNCLFSSLADRLTRQGYTCLRFDYRGDGESSMHSVLTTKSITEDTELVVNTFINKTGINKIYVISMCYGSVVFFNMLDKQKHNFIGSALLSAEIIKRNNGKRIKRTNVFWAYIHKLKDKETYIKLIKLQIDLKSIFYVLKRKNGKIVSDEPKTLNNIPIVNDKVLATSNNIPVLFLYGDQDIYYKNGFSFYQKVHKEFNMNWKYSVLSGGDHNFSSKRGQDFIYKSITAHLQTI